MSKKRSEQLLKENKRIHKNTLEFNARLKKKKVEEEKR